MDEIEISEIYEIIERELIANYKRNMLRHKSWEKAYGFEWPAWQAQKLKEMERFWRENEEIIGKYKDIISSETRKMLLEQYSEGEKKAREELLSDSGLFTEVSDDSFFGIFDEKIESLIEEVQGKETTAEKSALRMMDDVYRQTILKADFAVQTGSMTVQQAVELAVKDFARQGINCIEYKDGRRVNIADYAYMALQTSNTRAGLYGGAKQRALLGIDTVSVSQYHACSPTCQPWQGKVYIDDVYGVFDGEIYGNKGKSKNGKWYLLLSVAVDAGLFHPNCRHTLTSYREGDRDFLPVDGEETRRRYKLEQQQRAYERKIRKWKRMLEASDDPVWQQTYKKKVRDAQKDLREFIKEHSDVLRRDPWREKTYNTPNVSREENPDEAQYERYKKRLGELAPKTFQDFGKIKYGDSEKWIELQTEYRYQGIVDRLVEKNIDLRVFSKPSEIPKEYSEAVKKLSPTQIDGLYHYTHYEEGVRMNKALGGVKDISLTEYELQNLHNTESALNSSTIPYDTILWRGTESRLLDGFEALSSLSINEWKGQPLSYKGFTSTSIIKDASYMEKSNKDVQLILIKRAHQTGAAYVEDISYNKANGLTSEYEILLQKDTEYSIIEAQRFKGKYIIVAEVL